MTTSKCNCNCEPKCSPDECCRGLGDECQCKKKEEEEEIKTVQFEPEFDITIH